MAPAARSPAAAPGRGAPSTQAGPLAYGAPPPPPPPPPIPSLQGAICPELRGAGLGGVLPVPALQGIRSLPPPAPPRHRARRQAAPRACLPRCRRAEGTPAVARLRVACAPAPRPRGLHGPCPPAAALVPSATRPRRPAGGPPRMAVVGMEPRGWPAVRDVLLKLFSPLYVSCCRPACHELCAHMHAGLNLRKFAPTPWPTLRAVLAEGALQSQSLSCARYFLASCFGACPSRCCAATLHTPRKCWSS